MLHLVLIVYVNSRCWVYSVVLFVSSVESLGSARVRVRKGGGGGGWAAGAVPARQGGECSRAGRVGIFSPCVEHMGGGGCTFYVNTQLIGIH